MAASVSTPSQDGKTNFARLCQLIVGEGSRVLRKAFDRQQSSVFLKEELSLARPKLEKVLRNEKKKIVNDDQWKLLFPVSGEPSYNDFDITLLFVLLRNGVGNLGKFNPPQNGWDKMPDETEKSPEANFVRIKCYRNEVCHFPSAEIETNKFDSWWKNASEAIIALGADKNEIENLKSKPLDSSFQQEMLLLLKREQEMLQKLREDISAYLTDMLDTKKRDITTELPGHVPNFIGSKDNIDKIVQRLSDSKTNAVLLTGGPGYGKTTIAIEAAHEIAKETTVKFCRLREYANSFTDLLRQISFVCTGELQKQIEDDPRTAKYSLLKWCKCLDTHFVLLLDDIEEALEQHREEFTNLLGEMTSSSNRQIKFILTSRTELAPTTLFSVVKVPIQPLSTDHSVELIKKSLESSRLDKAEKESMIINDANIEKFEQVAKLCGCVPLALCIAGALLTDFKIEELIANLEDNPVKALDDTVSGRKSVELTIATSFKNLEERLKLSLISLSVFRGAFDKKAAKALLNEKCEETLRFFKAKSLLQSESDGKYSTHSLIQRYVQNVLKQGGVSHYHEAEQKYFDYFLQLLRDNSKIFWSKDGCKKSIELFNNDRIHTEHAITSLSRLAQSSVVFNEISVEEFDHIFSYAKMCVPPSLYESLLRSVLEIAEKSSDDTVKSVLLQVQVLCLLGNEIRKKTLGEEFISTMKQANEIRLNNKTKFESKRNKLIELCFWNSYIRYLNEMVSQKDSKTTQEELNDARKSLERTHSSHCEIHRHETLDSIQTLDNLGVKLYRTEKLYDKAEEKFLKSLKIKKQCLGDHISTFYSLKDLSDLELDRKKYKEALEHYQSAKQMLEKLNMLDGKEAILFLKNMASCLMSLEKHDEAKRTLQKAITIAEENFEGDHSTKLSLKSLQAVLCMNMGEDEDGKKNAREAVRMAERLERTQWPGGGKVVAIVMDKWKK